VEADDLGTYVLKFRGAGQGRKALVAEVIAGELARSLGFAVPEIVLMELDGELARAEPDPEIQDLIRASAGLNLALDYLPGSLGFDPIVDDPGAALASRIVWFDAFATNVDRSPRNTNLLTWHRKLWLIDHGASLYFHHNWPRGNEALRAAAARPYKSPYGHVLLPFATALAEADAALSAALTPEVLRGAVGLVPDEWLTEEPGFEGADEVRAAYVEYLAARLAGPRAWVGALEEARRETTAR
jgi:hypothetical protein